MRILVFSGPTLSQAEGKRILDAIYLPPLKQAEFLSAIERHEPDIMAIIDSYKGMHSSVWQNEVLYALDMGIKVYGAGDTGAIRAAELAHKGMIGVGRIYEMYKDRKIIDEDETVCLFGPKEREYLRLSEPMINLRETFKSALSKKVVNERQYQVLIDIAKALHWRNRSLDNILYEAEEAGVPMDVLARLKVVFNTDYQDIMKEDALKMLYIIRDLPEGNAHYCRNSPVIPDGNLLNVVYDRDRIVEHDGVNLSLEAIARHAILNHSKAEEINFHAMNRGLVVFMAGILKVEATEEDVTEEHDHFRKGHGLERQEDFDKWLMANDMSVDDFEELVRQLALCRKLRRWFLIRLRYKRNTRLFLDELRLRGEYETWAKKAVMIKEKSAATQDEMAKAMKEDGLPSILKKRMKWAGIPWIKSSSAMEMGFSAEGFRLQLIKEQIAQEQLKELFENMFS